MRDMVNKEIPCGPHHGGFHTFFGAILRILDKNYECYPDAKWLRGQMARISRAHDIGESAELCADMIAKFWVGHVLNERAKRSSDPMTCCIRVVQL